MIFKILEIIFVLWLFWFLLTQFAIPIIRNTKLLPLFREETKLKKELIDLNQKEVELNLKKVVKQRSKEVK